MMLPVLLAIVIAIIQGTVGCQTDCLDHQFDKSTCHQHGWYYLNNNWYRIGYVKHEEYPPKPLKLQEAEDYCKRMGGNLAKITCHNTNADVKKIVDYSGLTNCWIGLKVDQQSHHYKWWDGTDPQYTNWAGGRDPDKSKNGVKYCCMSKGGPPEQTPGAWYSYDCQSTLPVLCKVPAQPPPSFSCTEPWMYYTGMWFWTSPSNQLATHAEAKQICVSKGAELASEKYDLVLRLAYKQMCQIPGQEMWVIEPCEVTGRCRHLTDKETPELSYSSCDCGSRKRFTCVKKDPEKAQREQHIPPTPPTTKASTKGQAWHCKDNRCVTCNYMQRTCNWPYYTNEAYCKANCGR